MTYSIVGVLSFSPKAGVGEIANLTHILAALISVQSVGGKDYENICSHFVNCILFYNIHFNLEHVFFIFATKFIMCNKIYLKVLKCSDCKIVFVINV